MLRCYEGIRGELFTVTYLAHSGSQRLYETHVNFLETWKQTLKDHTCPTHAPPPPMCVDCIMCFPFFYCCQNVLLPLGREEEKCSCDIWDQILRMHKYRLMPLGPLRWEENQTLQYIRFVCDLFSLWWRKEYRCGCNNRILCSLILNGFVCCGWWKGSVCIFEPVSCLELLNQEWVSFS